MNWPYQLYRFYNGNGTSKTWGVCFNGDGTFTTVWGKTGNKMAIKVIEIDHPDKVNKLIRSKQRNGYEYLGKRTTPPSKNFSVAQVSLNFF